MDTFIARQPIFDRREKVFAYELLFRSNASAATYSATDPDAATFSVFADAYLLFGIDKLTSNKPAFINFTRNGLNQLLTTPLPVQSVVIELLEDIEPTEELVAICKKLKQQGYLLALDDFVFTDQYYQLLELADIIKIDFLATSIDERQEVITKVNNPLVKFLAEKVETRTDFEQANILNYTYFQGYFFSKPEIFQERKLNSFNLHHLKLFHEVQQSYFDLPRLEELIKGDISLSYQLLKYVNSAYFGFKQSISSIRHALVLLGRNQLERWLSLLILRDDFAQKPEELMMLSVLRAKFGELLVKRLAPEQSDQAFMVGLFSLIDCLLDRPLLEILHELPIRNDIKAALLGSESFLGNVLSLITSYERGDWQAVSQQARLYSIPVKELPRLYLTALEWSENYCRENKLPETEV